MKLFLLIFIVTVLFFPNPFCSISKVHEIGSKVVCSFTNFPILIIESVNKGGSIWYLLNPISIINELIVTFFSNFLVSLVISLIVFFGEDYLRKEKFKKSKNKKLLLPVLWILTAAGVFFISYFLGYISPLEITS